MHNKLKQLTIMSNEKTNEQNVLFSQEEINELNDFFSTSDRESRINRLIDVIESNGHDVELVLKEFIKENDLKDVEED